MNVASYEAYSIVTNEVNHKNTDFEYFLGFESGYTRRHSRNQ